MGNEDVVSPSNKGNGLVPDAVPSSNFAVSVPASISNTGTPLRRSKRQRTKQPEEVQHSELIPSQKTHSSRPTAHECYYVRQSLARLHPEVVDRNQQLRAQASRGHQDVLLDGVISTILSQNTTSANSTEAFRRLKERFPTYESLLETKDAVSQLEQAIRIGGLSKRKAERIHVMLQTLQKERGIPTLEYLRELSNDDVKKELLRFKGLGPKTISCVMLFAMGRAEFPVDTHVHRISKSIGWVGSKTTAEQAYEHLNAVIPDDIKLDLHCLLIAHGKACHQCAARHQPQFPPADGSRLDCPLVRIRKTKGLVQKQVVEVIIKKEEPC